MKNYNVKQWNQLDYDLLSYFSELDNQVKLEVYQDWYNNFGANKRPQCAIVDDYDSFLKVLIGLGEVVE